MIDRIVRFLLGWGSLRVAMIDEVHMYDLIAERLKEDAVYNVWRDSDGWRSWEYDEDLNRYIFNDVPRDTMLEDLSI